MRTLLSFICLGLTALTPMQPTRLGEFGAFTVVEKPDCVLSREIWGSWEVDEALSERLAPASDPATTVFTFAPDEDARKRITKSFSKLATSLKRRFDAARREGRRDLLAEQRLRAFQEVLAVGKVSYGTPEKTESRDFFIVCLNGNLAMSLLDAQGNAAGSTLVSIASDPRGDADLLFVGDYLVTAYRRARK